MDKLRQRFPDNINGINYRVVERLKNGRSDAHVLKIDTPDGYKILKKHPTKIENEVTGYELLKQTPIAPYMTRIYGRPAADTVIYDYFEGVQMREAIKNRSIPDRVILQIFNECSDMTMGFWTGPEHASLVNSAEGKNFPKKSVQRTQWRETSSLLEQVVEELAHKLGIESNDLKQRKISVDDGFTNVSLNDIYKTVDFFISYGKPDDFLFLSHGDLTSGNVVINYKGEGNFTFKIIDYEWAGLHDPAEAIAKMIRNKVAFISSSPKKASINISDPEVLAISLDESSIPKVGNTMQNIGLKKLQSYGILLDIPDFEERVLKYMAAFSLRDVALSPTREGLPDAIFSLAYAAKFINMIPLKSPQKIKIPTPVDVPQIDLGFGTAY